LDSELLVALDFDFSQCSSDHKTSGGPVGKLLAR
jgi:hypothetical protein